MDSAPFPPLTLESQHAAFDGPIPAGALHPVSHGKDGQAAVLRAALFLHDRLASDARQGAARRRAAVRRNQCRHDIWLNRLVATLAFHRDTATRLRDQRKANSQ